MTTVIADDCHMVSDSWVSYGDGRHADKGSKICRVRAPHYARNRGLADILIGYAGTVHVEMWAVDLEWRDIQGVRDAGSLWAEFRDWGKKYAPDGALDDTVAMILTGSGLYVCDSDGQVWKPKHPVWSIGSGSHFALGAFYAGSGLEAAATIACQLDTHSGGDVHSAALHLP